MTSIKDILSNEKLFDQVARAAFDSVDTDKSGEIDAKELGQIMKKLAQETNTEAPSADEVKEVLDALDEDKSGRISYEEFKVLIREVLENMMEEEQ
jgi:Ca2+-binding EF-hand superfamily protein